jgi:hypothetical protein
LLADKYYGHSMKYVSNQIMEFLQNKDEVAIFIHCREPKNIQLLKNSYLCDAILINNPNVEHIKSNMADANIYNFEYDYYIYNDGTLEELEQKAKKFVYEIIKKTK